MTETLEQVVDKVQAGDKEAFRQLIMPYRNKAFGLCYSMVRNSEDAKDILQLSFIKAYHNIGAFKKGSSFYTWLYRIVVNTAKDHLRKKARGNTLSLEDVADPQAPSQRGLLDEELKHKLEAAIAELPQRQKTVFVMKHMNDMKINEIAEVLQCGPSTVKIHLFRAVRNLRKKLSPYLAVEEAM